MSTKNKPLCELINDATPLELAYACKFGQAFTEDGNIEEHNNLFGDILPNLTCLNIDLGCELMAGDHATVRFAGSGPNTEICIRVDGLEISMNLLGFLKPTLVDQMCDGRDEITLVWDSPAVHSSNQETGSMTGRCAVTIPLSDLPLLVAALKKWSVYTERMAELS